jgi:hypothetical protein
MWCSLGPDQWMSYTFDCDKCLERISMTFPLCYRLRELSQLKPKLYNPVTEIEKGIPATSTLTKGLPIFSYIDCESPHNSIFCHLTSGEPNTVSN